MSEDNDTTVSQAEPNPETPQEDPLKNYKAEMERKFGNVSNQVQELKTVNQQLLAQIQQLNTAKAPETSEDDFNDLFIDNPREAARRIKEETAAEIRADIEKQQQKQQKQQSVLSELVQKFPELNDNSSELTQKAVEIYNSFSPEDQNDPKSYKLAVSEAAIDLGIQPMSRRKKVKSDDESFSVSGGSSSSSPAKKREANIDPKTLEFAKMIGMDVDNEKTIQSLKKRAQRTNWGVFK